jgi:DNA-binding Lrp family transcriptional regulator
LKQNNARRRNRATKSRVVELDDRDIAILKLVQRDNSQPLREIGRLVNLSTPAVARRLQRLRREGAIARETAVLDPVAVGRPLTLIVEIVVESELPQKIDELRQRFTRCPQIQHCYHVTGEVDFILIVNARDMEEYIGLTRTVFVGNITHYRTFVALERVKATDHIDLS